MTTKRNGQRRSVLINSQINGTKAGPIRTVASTLVAVVAVLWIPLTAKAALPAVTNLTLAWDPVGDAAIYTLYWGTASGNYTASNSCSVPQTSLAVSNLLANQFYYFAVTDTDGSGNQTTYSTQVVYNPAPGTLTVSGPPGGGSSAAVVWTSILNAATYTLYWGAQSGNYSLSQSCPGSQLNLTVTNLLANQVYYFAVAAIDASGNRSAYSTEVVYTTRYAQPAPPGSLAVSGPPGGGPSATASWGAVANVAAYQLHWGTISHNYAFNGSCPSSQTTLNVTGLQTNMMYYFAVACTGSNGIQSGNSAEFVYSNAIAAVSSTNPPAVTLASPQGLTASPGANGGIPGVALTWSAVANAAGYGLYWGTNSQSYSWSESGSSLQTVVTNLIGGEIYYFAVMALGGTGTNNSAFSSEVAYTNALASPGNFTASSVSNGVMAAWSPVADAANYMLFYGPQSGVYAASVSCPGSQTNLAVTNLVANSVYYLALAALATNGNQGPYSAEVIYTNTVTVATNNPGSNTNNPGSGQGPAILAPLAIGVAAGPTPNSAIVTWGGAASAASYALYWGTGTVESYSLSTSTNTSQTNVTIGNLLTNQSYVFLVEALDVNFQQISWGNPVGYTNVYVPPTPPATPGGLTLSVGSAANSATAGWSPVPNAAGYELYWGTGSQNYTFSNNFPGSQTTATAADLATNQTYYFAVTALGSNGTQSGFSSEVVYSNAAPPIPVFPPSTNQIPGIPPTLSISFPNQQPNLLIAGTVGAQMLVQGTTNPSDPLAWTTIETVTLTNTAIGSNTASANVMPGIVQAAFAPALQVYVPPSSNAGAPAQFYRVSMPYDYATLAYQTLPAQNYPTRLIGVIMQGLSENVCYVTNQYNLIYCDNQSFNIDVQASSDSSIRQIANSLAAALKQNWSLAEELSYTNGGYQLLATVVQTDPASDQVAGQQPPSPIQIDF